MVRLSAGVKVYPQPAYLHVDMADVIKKERESERVEDGGTF